MKNDRNRKIRFRAVQVLRQESGAALILVLCVMIVFFSLALTILASASNLMGNAKQDAVLKRCQVLAVSFRDLLDEELKNGTDGELQEYLRGEIETFSPEHPDWEEWTPVFQTPLSLDDYTLRVQFRWEPGSAFDGAEPSPMPYQNSRLFADIVCRYRENLQIYRVPSVYRLHCAAPEDMDPEAPDFDPAQLSWIWSNTGRSE